MTTQQALTAATLVVQSRKLMNAEVDGEIVALNVDTGTCYGLNKVGSHIWNLVATPGAISAIRDTLIKEYDVSADQCEAQLLRLLENLRAEGLIEVIDPAIPASSP